jgi:D-3-phosphoglycerate dehydrogenase
MYLSLPQIWTDVDLSPEARAILAGRANLTEQPEGSLANIEAAQVIIAGSQIRGDSTLFARSAGLLAIVRVGIGYERIDLDAATKAGVCAANTPDAPTESTAEFTITLMLAVARRLPTGNRQLSRGQLTSGQTLIGFDLAGKTLGLVGCGRIGSRVAEIARALHMDVMAFDPAAAAIPHLIRRVDRLSTLLAAADIVSLHAPALPSTRHLINAATLAHMKFGAILINTARGTLVDEAALFAALKNGHIAGAGLDVWEPEPPLSNNPLLCHPQVVATPHMAAMTREGRRRSHVAAAEQVLQIWRGEQPDHLLNPAVWARRRMS